MSIQENLVNFKRKFSDPDLFTAVLIVLVAVASFGLGRMSVEDTVGTRETKPSKTQNEAIVTFTESESKENGNELGMYVASKKGSKYHLPWCPGASQMNEENKIWFQDKEEAESAGYTPAANCKGI